MAAQNLLAPGSVEYVMLSDGPVSLAFYVPIPTGSTHNGTHKLVGTGQQFAGSPAGRFRTTQMERGVAFGSDCG